MRLNLGTGQEPKKGWVNHDRTKHSPEIDIAHDLNVLPWPWPDDSAYHIHAVSVFEHLDIDLVQALDECWRIIRPEGELYIKIPVYTSPFIHDDPTHRWQWSDRIFDSFDPDTAYGQEHDYYTDRKWRIVKKDSNQRNCWVRLEPRK